MGKNKSTHPTADKQAKEENTSKNTIIRNAKFAKGIDTIAKVNPELAAIDAIEHPEAAWHSSEKQSAKMDRHRVTPKPSAPSVNHTNEPKSVTEEHHPYP